MKKLLPVLLLAFGLTFAANAQTFEKVANVDIEGSQNPGILNGLNGQIYFAGFDSLGYGSNSGLWTSNGTKQGTRLLKPDDFTINTNEGTSLFYHGKLYYEAMYGPPMFCQVFVTDNTEQGSFLLKDVRIPVQNYPGECTLISFHDKIYFISSQIDSPANYLWESDGTENGTRIVKKLEMYPDLSFASGIIILNDKLFFTTCESGGVNFMLWTSDGTSTGTYPITPLYSNFGYGQLAALNGNLYFYTHDSTNNDGLWKSDGTAIGTARLKIINHEINNFTVLKNKLLFSTYDSLWSTDGTEAGTVKIAPVEMFNNFIVFKDKLFFDGRDSIDGAELWMTDGTAAGTKLVKDIFPGSDNSFPFSFVIYHNRLFFSATESLYGRQLYMSDGTEAGTKMISPGPVNINALKYNTLMTNEDALYFPAYYNSKTNNLWKLTLKTADSISDKKINIYPNPVTGNDINILLDENLTGTVQIQVNTLEGKNLVSSQIINNSGVRYIPFQIPLSIANGMYILSVSSEKERHNYKIEVMRW